MKSFIIILLALFFACENLFAQASDTHLNGEYIMTQLSMGEDSVPVVTYFAINLDGDGSGSWENLYTTDPPLENGNLTYSVNDDGTFTVDAEGQLMFRGIVHADGQSYTMANTGDQFGIDIGIRKSSGMSNASLNGEYIMTQLSMGEDSVPVVTYFAINLDGDGSGSWEDLYTTDPPLENGNLTYSVNDDGTFTVDVEGQLMFRGIVHADGQSYTMANTGDQFGINIGISKIDISTGIDSPYEGLPGSYILKQNYPNPFNPSTTISYSIPRSDFVTLTLYDISGREIQTLVNEYQTANTYSLKVHSADLSSGLYFYKLQIGSDFVETKKMLLLK